MKYIFMCSLVSFVFTANVWAFCQSNITASTPDERYTINTDGTVIDDQTGLMWMRCSLGQQWQNNTCEGETLSANWQESLELAQGVTFAGASNWRLPNIKELKSIIEDQCYLPAINENIFPNTPGVSYWSSSPIKSVDFYQGTDHETVIYGEIKVRLVREAP